MNANVSPKSSAILQKDPKIPEREFGDTYYTY